MNSSKDERYRFVVINPYGTADELLKQFIAMPHDFTVTMCVSTFGRRDDNKGAMVEICFETLRAKDHQSNVYSFLIEWLRLTSFDAVLSRLEIDDDYTVFGVEKWTVLIIAGQDA